MTSRPRGQQIAELYAREATRLVQSTTRHGVDWVNGRKRRDALAWIHRSSRLGLAGGGDRGVVAVRAAEQGSTPASSAARPWMHSGRRPRVHPNARRVRPAG